MDISAGSVALIAVVLLIIAAIIFALHILKKTCETNRKVADMARETAELKKTCEDFKEMLMALDNKTKDLSKNVGKIHLARHEEC